MEKYLFERLFDGVVLRVSKEEVKYFESEGIFLMVLVKPRSIHTHEAKVHMSILAQSLNISLWFRHRIV